MLKYLGKKYTNMHFMAARHILQNQTKTVAFLSENSRDKFIRCLEDYIQYNNLEVSVNVDKLKVIKPETGISHTRVIVDELAEYDKEGIGELLKNFKCDGRLYKTFRSVD